MIAESGYKEGRQAIGRYDIGSMVISTGGFTYVQYTAGDISCGG